jgi:hypothetical protein
MYATVSCPLGPQANAIAGIKIDNIINKTLRIVVNYNLRLCKSINFIVTDKSLLSNILGIEVAKLENYLCICAHLIAYKYPQKVI